jgi:aquaporin Z
MPSLTGLNQWADSAPRPARDGWHWAEWMSEFVGTLVLMFAVVSAWTFSVAHSPTTGPAFRIALLAVVSGLVVVIIALSPLGRRSGAHLNPVVTIGLWCQGIAGAADLAGYLLSQCAGGALGFAAGRVWGPEVPGPAVRWAAIAPPPGHVWLPLLIEFTATCAQLLAVYLLLSTARTARWAAPAAAAMLTGAILSCARLSGAGFNPVRGLAPDALLGAIGAGWIYAAGPIAGSIVAAGLGIALRRRPRTGKLHHDPSIPCRMRCELPHTPTA